MSRIGSALADLETHVGNFSIEALSGQLDPRWIPQILGETGKTSKRVRGIPADLAVWLLIAMNLFRRLSIRNLWCRLSEGFRGKLRIKALQPPTRSALTQARDRLGLEPLRLLFARFAAWLKTKFAASHSWKGFTLVAMDGTTAKVPDSKANRKHFGSPRSHRGRSGYPFLRMVTLVAVRTHLILAAAIAGWNTGENPLAVSLLPCIETNWLVLLDRGFHHYWLLWNILQKQSHFLIRKRCRLNLRKRRRLGPGDWLAEALLPRQSRREHPRLPERLQVRWIHYHIPGFRPAGLVTSLLDPELYPAGELVSLYHERWEQELAYDEMKTHLVSTAVPFRSRTPQRILQEAYGLLIAYNLLRGLMAEAAARAQLPPLRLSFVDSFERIERAISVLAVVSGSLLPLLYRELLQALAGCLLPARRPRRFPRVVKVKMSSFPLKR